MDYVIIILLLISIGSMHSHSHRTKNSSARIESSLVAQLFFIVVFLISISIMANRISSILSIQWYWSGAISIILIFLFLVFLANLYSSILGFKSKPQLSILEGGEYVRHNLPLIDSLITLIVGIILFFAFT